MYRYVSGMDSVAGNSAGSDNFWDWAYSVRKPLIVNQSHGCSAGKILIVGCELGHFPHSDLGESPQLPEKNNAITTQTTV